MRDTFNPNEQSTNFSNVLGLNNPESSVPEPNNKKQNSSRKKLFKNNIDVRPKDLPIPNRLAKTRAKNNMNIVSSQKAKRPNVSLVFNNNNHRLTQRPNKLKQSRGRKEKYNNTLI